MKVSRRTVLLGAAASAVLPPITLMGEEALVAATATGVEAPAAVAVPGWWGYSTNGGEWWTGCFGSREEAEGEGQSEGVDFSTGYCTPYALNHPDYREVVAEWLAASPGRWYNHYSNSLYLDGLLSESFSGSNEDADYEGELCEAVGIAEYHTFAESVRSITAFWLAARGVAYWEPGWFDPDNALLAELVEDAALGDLLEAAGDAWIDENDLSTAPRALHLSEEKQHLAERDEDEE